MRNMTGSLRVRNGKWQMVISYYDDSGKRRQKSISTGLEERGNKKKAQQMLDEYMEENGNVETLLNDIYFAEYLEEWFKGLKHEVRENTYKIYTYQFQKHILPYFKKHNRLLKELTQHDIKQYYKEKMDTLAVMTVKKHHANIHKALAEAVEEGLIKYNPAAGIRFPKRSKFVGQYYNIDELQLLKKLIKGSPIEVPVMLAVFYGLRRSEVLGLKWDAVDFNLNRVLINHTIILGAGGEKEVDDTKSETSKRYMPINDEIKAYLKGIRKQQLENKLFYGNAYIDSGYVCVYENGQRMSLDFLSRNYVKFREKNKDILKPIRFHDLRHSSATILLSLGFSLYDIKEWLGHSDISTTMIYAHYSEGRKNEMIEKFMSNVG